MSWVAASDRNDLGRGYRRGYAGCGRTKRMKRSARRLTVANGRPGMREDVRGLRDAQVRG